jgi:hypothetical protein
VSVEFPTSVTGAALVKQTASHMGLGKPHNLKEGLLEKFLLTQHACKETTG